MCFNFEPSLVEHGKKGELNEISLDENTLRAQIAAVDEHIAFYEADIKQSDAENAEIEADAVKLVARYDFEFLIPPDYWFIWRVVDSSSNIVIAIGDFHR